MVVLFQIPQRISDHQMEKNSGEALILNDLRGWAEDLERGQSLEEVRAAQNENLGNLQRVPLKFSAGGIPVRKPEVAREESH